MAYDFVRLADVEALSEVPENATVLAEVNGSIKRVPGNGLGGSGNGLVLVETSSPSSSPSPVSVMVALPEVWTFSANMTLDEAMELLHNYELSSAVVYTTYVGDSVSSLDTEVSSGIKQMDVAFVQDASSRFGSNCLVILGMNTGITCFWTADGISTEQPSRPE